jgi:hypothetical protein
MALSKRNQWKKRPPRRTEIKEAEKLAAKVSRKLLDMMNAVPLLEKV